MTIKLSEIKNDDILLVGESIMTKEELLNDWEYCKDKEIWTTTKPYKANINAREMLEDAIECEYQNMYDGWDEEIKRDITQDDIELLQTILNNILCRSANITYGGDEKVDVDN